MVGPKGGRGSLDPPPPLPPWIRHCMQTSGNASLIELKMIDIELRSRFRVSKVYKNMHAHDSSWTHLWLIRLSFSTLFFKLAATGPWFVPVFLQDINIVITYSCTEMIQCIVIIIIIAAVGAAAFAAEVRRHTANDAKCQELGWSCIPLAVETYSNWGKKAHFPD